jgi:hypothetical protein
VVDDNQLGPQQGGAQLAAPAIPNSSQAVSPATITTVAVPSAVEKDAEAVAVSLQHRVGAWLYQIYQSNKILFYTIIPVMGVVYLVIKYHDILIDLLLGSAKQLATQAQAKDAQLAAQAGATKSQADALVTQAQQAPAQEKPVPDDWYNK